jgi:hypothetical protein
MKITMISIDVSTLPTIHDKNSWDTFVDNIHQRVEVTQSACMSYWRRYSSWIVFLSITTVLLIVVICVVILSSKKFNYPCVTYDSNTKASDVSVECLQYTWNSFCALHPYTFPQGYTGWWRQSPQGLTMVSCHGTAPCGVGSYQNIITYMQSCRIEINQ